MLWSEPIAVQTIYVDVRVPVTYVRGEIDMSTDQVIQQEVATQLDQTASVPARPDPGRVHGIGRRPDGGYARRVLTLGGVNGILPLHWDVPTALRALG